MDFLLAILVWIFILTGLNTIYQTTIYAYIEKRWNLFWSAIIFFGLIVSFLVRAIQITPK